ncbi:hypothetical protein QQX10_10755 [Demequina sp. SYSU T00039]|uniref:Uncharacterized protein n=1 Tax=Demequina lignilytica TaxID=3051663 RepID=A0AAW7MA93_9MICO|nr:MULTISPECIES: hypothetical protein [unclassified Demequina]MDN4478669.1 hypothetical protein [Demequina sp. SYSU T00039-1]MDN4488647.1 hypothetical protein [Demequina sp. SYSU T00039]MDN4491633.1 hypothetical protein [Demequina sp. SYSU T00068]
MSGTDIPGMDRAGSAGEGWNPGTRRMHRDQGARAAIVVSLAMALLWWFDASVLVQSLVVAAAFGVETWIAYTRRDSVGLRGFGIAAVVALAGVIFALVSTGNALLSAGLGLLGAAVGMKDMYLGGLGLGISIAALRLTQLIGGDSGLQIALAVMLAGVLALLHVGVRRMGEDI